MFAVLRQPVDELETELARVESDADALELMVDAAQSEMERRQQIGRPTRMLPLDLRSVLIWDEATQPDGVVYSFIAQTDVAPHAQTLSCPRCGDLAQCEWCLNLDRSPRVYSVSN